MHGAQTGLICHDTQCLHQTEDKKTFTETVHSVGLNYAVCSELHDLDCLRFSNLFSLGSVGYNICRILIITVGLWYCFDLQDSLIVINAYLSHI